MNQFFQQFIFLLNNLLAFTSEPPGKTSILSRIETMNTGVRFFPMSLRELLSTQRGGLKVV